jgi:hypothetical protein
MVCGPFHCYVMLDKIILYLPDKDLFTYFVNSDDNNDNPSSQLLP